MRFGAFAALSLAILRGFVRDKMSVFFAIVFPLMFLVLFGGLFGDQNRPKVDLIQVGEVSVFEDLPPGMDEAFADTFEVARSDDLDDALDQVRKGDADVAVEQQGDTLIAHYTLTDQTSAAITQGALRSFVDGTNVALTGSPPTYSLQTQSVEDESLDVIQYFTPGLLGWAVAMSAAFGAAATLQGWRQTKLLRRLQLAPVSTRTVVAARVTVTVAIALVQLAIFLGVGLALFDLTLTGAWWMAIPLLVVGTLSFMALGLLAGAVTKTAEGAVNAANFLAGASDGDALRLLLPARRHPAVAAAGLGAAPAQAPQRRDARRDGARGAVDRGPGPDGDPGRVRGRDHPGRGQAVPLGDDLIRTGATQR